MEKPYSYFLSAILAGFLYSLIQPPFYFSVLAFIGLVPLFYLIRQQISLWQAALISGIFGLVYSGITMRWLWSAYPLENFGIHNRLIAFELLFAVWIITSIGLAVPWALLGAGIWRIRKIFTAKPLFYYLGIAGVVTLASYLGTYAISIIWLSIQIGIGPNFTYGNSAYALAHSPLALYLASYIGIYGITFLLALVNILIFHYAQKRSKLLFLIIGIVILCYIPLPLVSSKNPTLHFGIIQTAIPTSIDPNPSEKLSYFKQQLTQLNTLAKEHPETEVVVFPETSDFFNNLKLFLPSAQAKQYFNQLFSHPVLIVAGGKATDTKGNTYSRSFLLDTKKDIVGYHDKQVLTPMGEYLPIYITLPFRLIAPELYSQYIGNRQFQKGTVDQNTFTIEESLRVSPFICSELFSPGYIRTHLSNTHVIVAQTSTSIFKGNPALLAQNLAQAQFRAAENSTPILLSANYGQSYAINSRGIVTYQSNAKDWEILTGSLETGKNDSWYTKVADFPIIFVCFSILFLVFLHLKRHEQQN